MAIASFALVILSIYSVLDCCSATKNEFVGTVFDSRVSNGIILGSCP